STGERYRFRKDAAQRAACFEARPLPNTPGRQPVERYSTSTSARRPIRCFAACIVTSSAIGSTKTGNGILKSSRQESCGHAPEEVTILSVSRGLRGFQIRVIRGLSNHLP